MTSFTEKIYGIFDVFKRKNDKNIINKKWANSKIQAFKQHQRETAKNSDSQ